MQSIDGMNCMAMQCNFGDQLLVFVNSIHIPQQLHKDYECARASIRKHANVDQDT